MEKRPHNSTALCVGQVHQGVKIGQEGISGLQDTFGDIHKRIIPGYRVLPLKDKRRSFRAHCRGPRTLKVTEHLLQMKITINYIKDDYR